MFDVQVGDEVGYGRYHDWGTLLQHGFSRVVKINHHGHIQLANGKVFDKHGEERPKQYGGVRLMQAERLRAELDMIAKGKVRAQAAQELKTLIDAQRNGHGVQGAITEDVRAIMMDLVRKL